MTKEEYLKVEKCVCDLLDKIHLLDMYIKGLNSFINIHEDALNIVNHRPDSDVHMLLAEIDPDLKENE